MPPSSTVGRLLVGMSHRNSSGVMVPENRDVILTRLTALGLRMGVGLYPGA